MATLTEKQKKERELLHQQLQLLAKKSSHCSDRNLIRYSEQMVNIFNALKF